MDSFEELVQKWPKMSDAERKKFNEENRAQCSCPPCPTHAQCAKDRGELLFCFAGKSSCIKEMKVCFCPGCPVHDNFDLMNMYYCIRGDETTQRGQGKK